MLKLYKDQNQSVEEIQNAFREHKRVLFQLPTGGGKTVIFTWIAHQAANKNKKVLIISHRIELLSQAGGTMQEFGLNPQLITSKTKHVYTTEVSIAMTGTLKRRIDKIKWRKWFDNIDLIIVDECHRSEFNWLVDYESKYKLGVTATPQRSGKMPQLSDEYDIMIQGKQVRELINLKRLVHDYYLGVDAVSLDQVKKDKYGEYENNSLFDKFNTTKAYSGIVQNWVKYANGLCTIVFCINIQHCIKTCENLAESGIKAKFITSVLPKPNRPKELFCSNRLADWVRFTRKNREYQKYKETFPQFSGKREQVIQDWKQGEFPILVNAGIAVEGFDHKPTMCVVVYLATTSLNKWLQMIGRGSRVYPGKQEFILMDFGGNAERLGHYQQNRQWSLTHDVRISTGNTPYKNCPKCDSLIFVSSMICEFCGYDYPEKKEAEFAELVAEKTQGLNARTVNSKSMSHKEIEIFAQQKGYKSNWIWRTIFVNEGEDGLKKYAQEKKYNNAWVKIQTKIFEKGR